ncbi:MAG: zinc ribbon domain-containing protein [Planctomycetota bacterium]
MDHAAPTTALPAQSVTPGRASRVAGPVILAAGVAAVAVATLALPAGHGLTMPLLVLGLALLLAGVLWTGFTLFDAPAPASASRATPAPTLEDDLASPPESTTTEENPEDELPGLRDLSVRCPACDTRNDVGVEHCVTCHGPLSTTRPCPTCETENEHQAKRCDHCGTRLLR